MGDESERVAPKGPEANGSMAPPPNSERVTAEDQERLAIPPTYLLQRATSNGARFNELTLRTEKPSMLPASSTFSIT